MTRAVGDPEKYERGIHHERPGVDDVRPKVEINDHVAVVGCVAETPSRAIARLSRDDVPDAVKRIRNSTQGMELALNRRLTPQRAGGRTCACRGRTRSQANNHDQSGTGHPNKSTH